MSLTNRQTGTVHDVDYKTFLTANQRIQMINDPYLVLQLSKYIHKKGKEMGVGDAIVKVNLSVEFNGRPSQLMIDSSVDLSRVDGSYFSNYDWIVPLKPIN